MDKKEKTSVADIIDKVVNVLPIVFIILVLALGGLRMHIRTESAVTVATECQVVDKFAENHGKFDHYFLTLQLSQSGVEFEKDIQISVESFGNGADIGDTLPCTVMYDDKGIIKIQVSDSSLVQQIDYQKEYRIVLIVLGSIGVVSGIIGFFLLLKKLDKSAYEQSIAKDKTN